MLIINTQTGQFHTTYRPDRISAAWTMTRPNADAVEQLTFAIELAPAGAACSGCLG